MAESMFGPGVGDIQALMDAERQQQAMQQGMLFSQNMFSPMIASAASTAQQTGDALASLMGYEDPRIKKAKEDEAIKKEIAEATAGLPYAEKLKVMAEIFNRHGRTDQALALQATTRKIFESDRSASLEERRARAYESQADSQVRAVDQNIREWDAGQAKRDLDLQVAERELQEIQALPPGAKSKLEIKKIEAEIARINAQTRAANAQMANAIKQSKQDPQWKAEMERAGWTVTEILGKSQLDESTKEVVGYRLIRINPETKQEETKTVWLGGVKPEGVVEPRSSAVGKNLADRLAAAAANAAKAAGKQSAGSQRAQPTLRDMQAGVPRQQQAVPPLYPNDPDMYAPQGLGTGSVQGRIRYGTSGAGGAL